MGDRANVLVTQDGGKTGVYLYSHWEGTGLPQLVQSVLSVQTRWDDAQYLARMIFCKMIQDDVSGSTGYGIGCACGDGDSRILVVDTYVGAVAQARLDADALVLTTPWMPFRNYIALNRPQWGKDWRRPTDD